MISIGNVTGGKIASYYSQEDYYFKPNSDGNQVYGKSNQAESFRKIESLDQRELFEEYPGDRETRAKDLTFSAPKSVSLMFACGTPEQQQMAIEIHQEAVAKSMEYVEKNLFHVQKKEHGQVKKIKAQGMVGLGFDHSISREKDPQLHSHILIANAGFIDGHDKSFSVNYKSIYDSQRKIDRIYKASLRTQLEKSGFRTRQTKDGFELESITDHQILSFSVRKAQVDQALLEAGLTRHTPTPGQEAQVFKKATSKQRDAANRKTRKSKAVVDDQELKGTWIFQGEELEVSIEQGEGLQPASDADLKKAIYKGYESFVEREPLTTIHQASDEILKYAEVEHGADPKDNPLVTQEDIEKFLPEIMKDFQMLRLPGQTAAPGDLNERFVSKKLLKADKANVQYLVQGKNIYDDLATDHIDQEIDAVAKEIFLDFTFGGEQRDAAIGILKSKSFICGIQGDPGTGKTTLLQAVARVQGENSIIALSKAGAAAKKLGDEIGVQARTIDKFVIDYERKKKLLSKPGPLSGKDQKFLRSVKYLDNLVGTPEKPALIIVDEASMAGDFDVNRLCKIADATNAKIILTGDMYQLPGVSAGETFRKFQEQGMETFDLKDIRRHDDDRHKKAVEAITMDHDVQKSVELLKYRKDLIQEIKGDADRLAKIKEDYIKVVQDGGLSPLLITSTNSDKDALNAAIREELKNLGRLDSQGEIHSTFNSKKLKVDLEICPGEKLVFLQNDNQGKVKVSDGQKVLNGDQMIVGDIKDGLAKGFLVDDEGRVITGKEVQFSLEEYNRVDHSYALSTYKSQGQSVERDVMYHTPSNSPLLSKNEFLVGISRNKLKLSLYTDDIQKMIEKASKWVTKNDATKAFEHGITVAEGRSEKIRSAVYSTEQKLKRDSEIFEDRQALVDKYGLFSNAPKEDRQIINERLNASRGKFYADLRNISDAPASSATKAEKDLLKDLKKWIATMAKAEKKFKSDRSRNRTNNYFKSLNKNDSELTFKILQLQGNQVDRLDLQKYIKIENELAELQDTWIFQSEKTRPTPAEPSRFHEVVLDEDGFKILYLERRKDELERKLAVLEAGLSTKEKDRIFKATLAPAERKVFEKAGEALRYNTEKGRDLLIDLNQVDLEIEDHEMVNAGIVKTLFNPGKSKDLEGLEEKRDRLQVDKKASAAQIRKADKVLTEISDKLDTAYGQQEAKNIVLISDLHDKLDSINDELYKLDPPVVEVPQETIEEVSKPVVEPTTKPGVNPDHDAESDLRM